MIDAGEELRRDEEAAAVSRNAATAEVAGTSGSLMAGAATWAIHGTDRGVGGADAVLDGSTNVGGMPATAPAEGAARGLTLEMIKQALRRGWDEGAMYTLMMSTGEMIETISDGLFDKTARVATLQTDVPQANRQMPSDGNGARRGGVAAQSAVSLFIGSFGAVTLVPNRQMFAYDSDGGTTGDVVEVLFIDPRFPMMATLHGYDTKRLGIDGLYDQEVLYCDKTFIPGSTYAVSTIADVAPGTDLYA